MNGFTVSNVEELRAEAYGKFCTVGLYLGPEGVPPSELALAILRPRDQLVSYVSKSCLTWGQKGHSGAGHTEVYADPKIERCGPLFVLKMAVDTLVIVTGPETTAHQDTPAEPVGHPMASLTFTVSSGLTFTAGPGETVTLATARVELSMYLRHVAEVETGHWERADWVRTERAMTLRGTYMGRAGIYTLVLP